MSRTKASVPDLDGKPIAMNEAEVAVDGSPEYAAAVDLSETARLEFRRVHAEHKAGRATDTELDAARTARTAANVELERAYSAELAKNSEKKISKLYFSLKTQA